MHHGSWSPFDLPLHFQIFPINSRRSLFSSPVPFSIIFPFYPSFSHSSSSHTNFFLNNLLSFSSSPVSFHWPFLFHPFPPSLRAGMQSYAWTLPLQTHTFIFKQTHTFCRRGKISVAIADLRKRKGRAFIG